MKKHLFLIEGISLNMKRKKSPLQHCKRGRSTDSSDSSKLNSHQSSNVLMSSPAVLHPPSFYVGTPPSLGAASSHPAVNDSVDEWNRMDDAGEAEAHGLSGSLPSLGSNDGLQFCTLDESDFGSSNVPDLHRTKVAMEHIQQKIGCTKDLNKAEQKARYENAYEYVKLVTNADKQQLQRMKRDKKHQKSAQLITQLQKKLENYNKRIRDLETHGLPSGVLRDMGQGLMPPKENEMDLPRSEQIPTTLCNEKGLGPKRVEGRFLTQVGEVTHSPRLYDRFEWTIHDVFNAFDEKQLESPIFQSDGTLWWMRITPNGMSDDVDSYMDLQLCGSLPSPGARYQVRIGLKKANGRDSQRLSSETDLGRFLEVHKLLHWRSTGSSRFVSDGCLTIFCELSPSGKGSKALSKMTTTMESDTSLLIENLRDLYASGANSDVGLSVGGKVFKVHKAIVRARCPVFSSMFQHDMHDNSNVVVEIPDCSADAFAVFLRYLYTGEMGEVTDQKLLCNLYYIANKYNVQELKGRCSGLLTDALSVGSFCDIVSLALRHSESALLKSACEFFTQNVKAIIPTARWQTYLTENPIHANELFMQSINAQPAKKDDCKP